MHDTVDLEDRGLPSVFISTVEFIDDGEAVDRDVAEILHVQPVEQGIALRRDRGRVLARGHVDRVFLEDEDRREDDDGVCVLVVRGADRAVRQRSNVGVAARIPVPTTRARMTTVRSIS